MNSILMNSTSWTRSRIVLTVATLTVAGTIGFVSLGLSQPKPFANTVLSNQWQCTQTAGILTVCTKKHG